MGRFLQPLAHYAGGSAAMWHTGLNVSNSDIVLPNVSGTGSASVESFAFLGYRYAFMFARRTAGADGFWGTRYHLVNAHAYLDARFINWPYTFEARTVAITDHTTDRGVVFWGIGTWWDTTEASLHGIGFYAVNGGNWFAIVKDDTTTHLNVDTGIASGPTENDLHELLIQLDGRTRTATLSIDGDVVGTVTFTATTVLAQLYNEETWHPVGPSCWTDAAGPGSTRILWCAQGRDPIGGMALGSSDLVVVVPPVISSRITYQRILNLARTRAPEFVGLVIDDQQIMDELNNLTLELIQEGSDADHTAFQEVVNWLTDVFPALPVTDPVSVDLRDFDSILVPSWVNTVYAVEGIQLSNDKKIRIDVQTKESQIRDRPIENESVLYDMYLDSRLVRPRALKVWDSTESVWRLVKNTDYTSPSTDPWTNIYDANLVVSGVRLPMSTRADLTDAIPVPFRALKPLTEAYALILGGRAGKDRGWTNDQRTLVELEYDKFRQWINIQDMSIDEGFDPEIGAP